VVCVGMAEMLRCEIADRHFTGSSVGRMADASILITRVVFRIRKKEKIPVQGLEPWYPA
jgi:hypothetical protein